MTMIKTSVEMVNKSNLLVFWHFQSASCTLPNQLDTGGRHWIATHKHATKHSSSSWSSFLWFYRHLTNFVISTHMWLSAWRLPLLEGSPVPAPLGTQTLQRPPVSRLTPATPYSHCIQPSLDEPADNYMQNAFWSIATFVLKSFNFKPTIIGFHSQSFITGQFVIPFKSRTWDLEVVGASFISAENGIAVEAGEIPVVTKGQTIPRPLHWAHSVPNLMYKMVMVKMVRSSMRRREGNLASEDCSSPFCHLRVFWSLQEMLKPAPPTWAKQGHVKWLWITRWWRWW